MSIKVGDKVPGFNAVDTHGNPFHSHHVIGKKATVIFFYPKDDTPQCTAEACGFRDNYEEFLNYGVEVIGISSDSVDSHQSFARKYNLPFVLLSDPDKKIRKLFGVPPSLFGLLPGRVTYLVDKEGVVISVFDSLIGSKHVENVLANIKEK